MNIRELFESSNPWWADGKMRAASRLRARRDVFEPIRALVEAGTGRAVVLLGPRQVGKSTLLLQLVDALLDAGWPPRAIFYLDFSDPRLLTGGHEATIRHAVAIAEADAAGHDGPRAVLLDEVSHGANWDRELKQAVDKARRSGRERFVVTDSSASVLRGGGRESGVGRWDEVRMEGLSFREYLRIASGGAGNEVEWLATHPPALGRYLALGGFPEHARSETEDFAMVRERIRNDVADRAIARDLARYGVELDGVLRLFQYLVRDSGAIFTAKQRGEDVGADRRSVVEWARLLEDAQIVARLEAFTKNAAARLRSKPRIYAADHALLTAFSLVPSAPEDAPDVRSRIFEAVVYRHLRDVARRARGELSYFRSPAGLEADFVLELGRRRFVVEVTSSAAARSEKQRSAKSVANAVGATRSVVVYGGPTIPDQNDVAWISLRDFLLEPERSVTGEPA